MQRIRRRRSKRFDFLSSLNTKAIQAYESDASLREGFLKDVEKNSPDFPAVVLEKLYKDNPEKQAELAECFKTKDLNRLNTLYETAKRESPKEVAKIREEKGNGCSSDRTATKLCLMKNVRFKSSDQPIRRL